MITNKSIISSSKKWLRKSTGSFPANEIATLGFTSVFLGVTSNVFLSPSTGFHFMRFASRTSSSDEYMESSVSLISDSSDSATELLPSGTKSLSTIISSENCPQSSLERFSSSKASS
ncbi:hypothetical protein NQ314_018620 [Rhamnusium bicolor]|uniref:Uncharacterized protein n=1 Tax=Rhamnusium bicolor TaxID=1586634 RepID=A0AAV8WR73_9CUCU|nr:hypothetical protein NQ314_018620 [Rhamnusium bicolor]